MIHTKRTHCRACGGDRLRVFLELGPQPLANSFLKSPAEFTSEQRFPLDVYFCESCSLVQLLDVIDPEVLFRNYIYVTGTSATIAAHNVDYARTVVGMQGLTKEDLVVEVASNDGSLLKCFRSHGVRVLGVEPARNIAELARDQGIETENRFFNSVTAREIRASHGLARAVIGNNVLAHVDDTQDFLRGAAALLTDDGLVIVEVPYLSEFMDRLEYDTVYHEHLCYFSVSALMRLCETVGLSMIRVDRVPVHGGTIRVYAALRARHPDHAHEVRAMAQDESREGLTSLARFREFGAQVAENRRALLELLRHLKASGKRVAGYGAPAKGNTLLNYCGITTDLIPYTVDRNPLKVGTYAPGSHIPVRPYEGTYAAERPDHIVILAWNFAEEIMRQPQEQEFHRRGGRFIVPIPTPRIV